MRIKIKNILLLSMALLLCTIAFSQRERQLLRKGNQAYEEQDYAQAKEMYTKSIDVAPSNGKARFNLGNAEYMNGDPMAAAKQFEMAAADAIDKGEKSKAYYNEANCYLNAGLYLKQNPPQPEEGEDPPNPQDFFKKSIVGYKNALRNNPTDEESRYNLAYAQSLIEEEQNGGGDGEDQQQEQEQEQDGDQDQQDKEQDQDGDNKDEKEQENSDKGDEKEEEQQQQPKPGEMTKKEAEQMLKALEQQEKDLQGRKGLERIEGEKIEIDKDW